MTAGHTLTVPLVSGNVTCETLTRGYWPTLPSVPLLYCDSLRHVEPAVYVAVDPSE